MAETVDVHGTCDPQFERFREAFAENFTKHSELGAAVAITLEGRPVVDLWGGTAVKKTDTPWERNTLANVYSTTKGMTAICAHRLVEQGTLDLDAPVAKYWPEFAQAGKEQLPVRYLLSHRAGLAAVAKPLPAKALYDWDAMTTALAEQEPWWEPGTAHGYHAVTFGWLVGEVVRRISGKSLGTFFRDEVAGPLGLDCYIGLGPEYDDRIAHMSQMALLPQNAPAPKSSDSQPETQNFMQMIMQNAQSVTAKAFMNPPTMMTPGVVNTRDWRAAEIPAANGHTDARSLARMYGALACGGALEGYRVLTPESIARCHTEQSCGRDQVLQVITRFGLGFMLSQDHPDTKLGPNERAFGHPGAGGSLGYADCDAQVGFGYVMNQMGMSLLIDPRPRALISALYNSL